MPRATMAKICCGATSGVPGRLPKRRCVREKSLEGWRGYANTSWGSSGTDCSLRLLSSVYVRKSSTRKAAWSYAVPTWRTEWPSCLGLNPVFPRCSKTVFEAGPGLEAASSTQPADKQRAGITFAVGLGRLLGWEASEVTEGQARGTHQRRRPRGHRRQQQNELADEESLAAHLSVLRAVQFSLSKCREAPVPLPAKTPIAPPPPALRHRHPSSEGGRARAGRGRP